MTAIVHLAATLLLALSGLSPAARLSRAQALREAGEHVIAAYPGETPPASLLGAIRAGHVAGVILFAANTADISALRAATAAMQRAARAAPGHLPLLILTDQEGGQVRRLPGAPAQSEKQIGASADPAAAASGAGRAAAENLRADGVNVNLAPVLDVYRRAGDFDDQYGRSYSDRAAVAAAAGAAFVRAQQTGGVAATAKHFPGLGAAASAQNTDLGPVTLDPSAAQLRGSDEAPFRAAIRAGVKLVMLSWATYPALDADHPAGLSSAIIERELRTRLNFAGVTITDAISAGALSADGSIGRRSVLASQAGEDLILACGGADAPNGPQVAARAVGAMATALMRGQINPVLFAASALRVQALRRALG